MHVERVMKSDHTMPDPNLSPSASLLERVIITAAPEGANIVSLNKPNPFG